MPVGHRGQATEAEHALLQAGVEGARGRARKLRCRAGLDGLLLAGEAEYLLGELGPGRFAFAGQVESPRQFRML